MPVIGLTGNIASGKSLVSRTLQDLGAQVIDADSVARSVVKPGTPGWKQVIECFGQEILNPDGTINRKELGSRVFGDPRQLKMLNSITHPLILEEIEAAIKNFREQNKEPDNVLVIDAPLLIETGLQRLVDEVWMVDLPEQIQVERLMARNRLTRDEAMKRISSQMPADEKKKLAQVVIDNSGDVMTTQKTVRDIWQRRFMKPGVERFGN